MDLSRPSPAPTRYVGIGLVVALHLAGIYALSAGLIKAPPRPHEPIVMRPLAPELPLPTPPAKPVQAAQPRLDTPQLIQVPIPDIIVESAPANPTVTTAPLTIDASTATHAVSTRVESLPSTAAQPVVGAPGAICSVMPRPEVPAVNWNGETVLNVLATVRGGRVVASEFRVAQGAVDARTRRSLQRAVESALAGYQCQGDAMFQQDFAFRVD